MKKICTFIMTATLLFVLAACGGSTSDYTPVADTPFDSTPTIATAPTIPNDPALPAPPLAVPMSIEHARQIAISAANHLYLSGGVRIIDVNHWPEMDEAAEVGDEFSFFNYVTAITVRYTLDPGNFYSFRGWNENGNLAAVLRVDKFNANVYSHAGTVNDQTRWELVYTGDPATPAQTAPAQTPLPPPIEPQEDSGIIAVVHETQGRTVRTVIVSICPLTGSMRRLREFTQQAGAIPPGSQEVVPSAGTDLSHPRNSQALNENMDRLASIMVNVGAENSTHVGWVDAFGNFFDVTALVTEPQGDFSGTIWHSSPRFGPDGYFYFASLQQRISGFGAAVQGIYDILRVPLDNLRPDAVEVVLSDVRHDPMGGIGAFGMFANMHVCMDGSVNFGFDPFPVRSAMGDYVMYIGNTWRTIGFTFSQWVDNTTVLATYNGRSLSPTPTLVFVDAVPMGTGVEESVDIMVEDMRQILPSGTNRISWNGVMSPDGTEIAFLSRTTTAAEPELFIAGVNGENPRRVDVASSLVGFQILLWN